MKIILLFVLLTSLFNMLSAQDYIYSANLSTVRLTSESELKDINDKKAFTFNPNLPSATGLALEIKHFTLSYIFAGNNAEFEDFQKSTYRDLRLNFSWDHFDVRLNYQNYKGAIVNAGGVKQFYNIYEVKSKNARIHYYFDKEILNYIRDGHKLTNKAISNVKFNHMGSWLIGFNLDNRMITLPSELAPQHRAILNQRNISHQSSFNAVTFGPLICYDYFLQWNSIFSRLKIGAGPGFQSKGGASEQLEVAFNIGFAFLQNHSLVLSADNYVMTFKDGNKKISNRNSLSALSYNYTF